MSCDANSHLLHVCSAGSRAMSSSCQICQTKSSVLFWGGGIAPLRLAKLHMSSAGQCACQPPNCWPPALSCSEPMSLLSTGHARRSAYRRLHTMFLFKTARFLAVQPALADTWVSTCRSALLTGPRRCMLLPAAASRMLCGCCWGLGQTHRPRNKVCVFSILEQGMSVQHNQHIASFRCSLCADGICLPLHLCLLG